MDFFNSRYPFQHLFDLLGNLPINLMDDPLFCVVLGTGKILDDFDRYRPVIMKGGRD